MRRAWKALLGWLAVMAALILLVLAAYTNSAAAPAAPVASFAVKIDMPDKHGSGVHIGGGYILTAAHVAEGGGAIKVVTDLGASRDAEVLWLNNDYDIALLRIADYADVGVAHLSCTTPLLGATHGHEAKIRDMPAIMAHRRAEDWGATKFRYIHGFHLHHSAKFATEGGGCISEVHQTPTPQDAWHYGSGFLSGRSLQSITYDAFMGEVGRTRVAIIDGETPAAANDNEPQMRSAA